MKQETTESRVATWPAPTQSLALLIAAIYGMAGGLTLALLLTSGLLPVEWVDTFRPGPLALQGMMTGVGAVVGMVVGVLRD